MYGCMGMAALAKGPVGVVLPTAVLGMYLLIQRLPATPADTHRGTSSAVLQWLGRLLRPFAPTHFLRTFWSMRPVTALVMVLVVALPWYAAVAWRTDGQWVRGFLLDHNLGCAAQSLEGHGGSVLYYPLALLVGFFPWSVFAVPVALDTVYRLRSPATDRAAHILALCWLGVYIGLFSIAQHEVAQLHHAELSGRGIARGQFPCGLGAGTSRVARHVAACGVRLSGHRRRSARGRHPRCRRAIPARRAVAGRAWDLSRSSRH